MARYDDVQSEIARRKWTWLVTGGAGFIGGHLVDHLVKLGQHVRVLDNFSTGKRENIAAHEGAVELIEGDCSDTFACRDAVKGVDVVLHQAALGSVPRSLADPLATHRANVDGFIELLVAARDAKVRRFVYASSSSVYGDSAELPKVEERIGKPLSPYASTKLVDEIYARTFQEAYGVETVGLRYFNVFGPRQDPNGPYAAVVPKWIAALTAREKCVINGDGETSRDFCYVDNAVQANLLASLAPSSSTNHAYNVACGARTTLNELLELLAAGLGVRASVTRAGFRDGDVRHSLASIDKAQRLLGYAPTHDVKRGIAETLAWYAQRAA
jgi:UDP-N-acetylglucosamine 4-epimerase